MLHEIEDAGVRAVGHVPNGTCHGHVCDDQIPVNPVDREGSEDKLSVVARESERFAGGKEQGKYPQPSSQARLHLAERVLSHPPSPLLPALLDNLIGLPTRPSRTGVICLDCDLSAVPISVAVGHCPETQGATLPLGSLVEDCR